MAQVVGMVASVGVSYFAGTLINKNHSVRVPGFPNNDTTRGGYLPLVMGRRVVGCHVGWVGDRHSHAAPNSGGGGSEVTPQPSAGNVYFEGGWHQICHGPVRRLYRIWAGNEVIFSKMLDSADVADGTLFQLAIRNGAREADYFRFFFGRDPAVDPSYQPVDAYLAAQTGLQSCWPGLCYCVWQRKNLGGAPTWPLMRYEIETMP